MKRWQKMMSGQRIKHMVIFCLTHESGSADTAKFLEDGRVILSSIPTVENFQAFHQVSAKNDYDYGFSMDFADQAAYTFYNDHPLHVDFVNNRWLKEVSRFLEIDFQAV
jgi:hypothetical protein